MIFYFGCFLLMLGFYCKIFRIDWFGLGFKNWYCCKSFLGDFYVWFGCRVIVIKEDLLGEFSF